MGLVLLAGISWAPMGSANGSCSAPVLKIDDLGPLSGAELWQGETAMVLGSAFVDGCGDEEGEHAMREVALVLRQGTKDWVLGVEDADTGAHLGQVTWRVRIPAGVEPGRAVLVAGGSELTVTVGARQLRRVTPASWGRTTDR